MTPEECRENLVMSKKKLVAALASHGNEKAYWANMKAWFKQRISKEEFDIEARQLLLKESTHLHNEFLLAVLTKCHSTGSAQGNKDGAGTISLKAKRNKRKIQALKRKFDNRFVTSIPKPLPPARSFADEKQILINQNNEKPKELRFPKHIVFCSKSLEIPGMLEMNGRVAVITWEKGLDDFTDDVSQIVINAIHNFLKNIVSVICAQRSSYKTRGKGFCFNVGCTAENPYLMQKAHIPSIFGPKKNRRVYHDTKPTYDEAEQMAIECMGRAEQELPPSKRAANMSDLLQTLQNNKHLIPSHSVYGLCMERIISSQWHPDNNEIKQDQKFAQLIK